MLAEAMENEFESAAYKLVGKESIGKLMHNGTKILAEIGSHALTSIIRNVISVKIVERL